MEEIFEKIKNEINLIQNEQNELNVLTENSEKLRIEIKGLQDEQSTISDKESGFYKDLTEKINVKNAEFIDANSKRMDENNKINELISMKKEEILNELAAKKKYIDENRNANLEGIDLAALKEEKERLEEEIKLNDTPREEFDKLSDEDKQAVRRAKERYLINKNRLNEINPTIELMDALEGKNPKDKFLEIESLEKQINEKFNLKDLNELESVFNKEELESEVIEEPEPEVIEEPEQEVIEELEPEVIEEPEPEVVEESEPKVIKEPEPKIVKKPEPEIIKESKPQPVKEPEHLKITLNPDNNTIYKNNKLDGYYKAESKSKNDLMKKYSINSYFVNDKKLKKNIDYALLSELEKQDNGYELAMDYLRVIKGGTLENKGFEQSLEELNKYVQITYKFNKEAGIITNLKAKKLARNAHKLGIASLDGISDKGLFDIIKTKITKKLSNTKLLKNRKQPEALTAGKESISQKDKQKAVDLIKGDRKALEEKGYEGLVNTDYLKEIEPKYRNALEGKLKVDNSNNEIEKRANEAIKEQEQKMATEVQLNTEIDDDKELL